MRVVWEVWIVKYYPSWAEGVNHNHNITVSLAMGVPLKVLKYLIYIYIYLYLLTLIKALRGVGWQKKNCDTVNCDNAMKNESEKTQI